jgi:cytochrome c-type biogenesis protein CcmE
MSATLTPRRKRLLLIVAALALLAAAGGFVMQAFKSNLAFYVTPGELTANDARTKELLRVGGMVQAGSVQRSNADARELRFVLTDGKGQMPVYFKGALPDLFAEGKGAIVLGRLDASGTLVATEVMAKHDENYMPPKVGQPGHPGDQPMREAAAQAAEQKPGGAQ